MKARLYPTWAALSVYIDPEAPGQGASVHYQNSTIPTELTHRYLGHTLNQAYDKVDIELIVGLTPVRMRLMVLDQPYCSEPPRIQLGSDFVHALGAASS